MKKRIFTVLGLSVILGLGVGYTVRYGVPGSEVISARDSKSIESLIEGTFNAEVDVDEKYETDIILDNNGSEIKGKGASVNGRVIRIVAGGVYRITGSLDEGQIYVETSKSKQVTLVLDGVNMTNTSDSVIYIKKAGSVFIKTADASVNTLISGREVELSEEYNDPDASGGAIYSKSDLGITGEGVLNVYGYINNGIHTADNLFVSGGTVNVKALNHGVKGKDSITFSDGCFTIESYKDGLHSEGRIEVDGGEIVVIDCDDGIHSDTELEINGGRVDIRDCYEGLEANQLCINGGEISVVSEDDGMNAAGDEAIPTLTINGGKIYVDASGDGLDSNGDIYINDGYVIVDGPSDRGNTALDCGSESGGALYVNGGTVLAIGSSGMAEKFSDNSEQCSFMAAMDEEYEAGKELAVLDKEGNALITYTTTKRGNCVIFSSPELKLNETYQVKVDSAEKEIEQDSVSAGDEGFGFGRGGFGKDGFGRDGFGRDGFDKGDFEGRPPMEGMEPPEGFEGRHRGEGMEPTEGFEGRQRGEGMEPPEGFEGRHQKEGRKPSEEGMNAPEGDVNTSNKNN